MSYLKIVLLSLACVSLFSRSVAAVVVGPYDWINSFEVLTALMNNQPLPDVELRTNPHFENTQRIRLAAPEILEPPRIQEYFNPGAPSHSLTIQEPECWLMGRHRVVATQIRMVTASLTLGQTTDHWVDADQSFGNFIPESPRDYWMETVNINGHLDPHSCCFRRCSWNVLNFQIFPRVRIRPMDGPHRVNDAERINWPHFNIHVQISRTTQPHSEFVDLRYLELRLTPVATEEGAIVGPNWQVQDQQPVPLRLVPFSGAGFRLGS